MTDQWHDTDAVDEYVTGQLAAERIDAFEEHILGCASCRESVRAAAAARVAMRTQPGGARRPHRAAWIGIPALAAALVIAVLIREQSVRHRLGGVSPAVFAGASIRAPGDSVASLVDRGMDAYARADWSEASAILSDASRSDSTSGVAFYLGVARLMNGDPRGGLAALYRAREPSGNPYADDALFYAAKALVRLGHPDSALVLIRGAAADGAIGATLRAFGDSLSRR